MVTGSPADFGRIEGLRIVVTDVGSRLNDGDMKQKKQHNTRGILSFVDFHNVVKCKLGLGDLEVSFMNKEQQTGLT